MPGKARMNIIDILIRDQAYKFGKDVLASLTTSNYRFFASFLVCFLLNEERLKPLLDIPTALIQVK